MASVATAVVIVASLGTATPLVAAIWAGAGAGFVGGALGTALNGGGILESLTAGLMGAGLGAISGGLGAYFSAAIGAVGIIPGALSGSAISSTLGILGNVMTGKDWDSGLGMNATFGALGGGYSGFSAAKNSGAGTWFGTPPPRPQVTTITHGLTPAGISKTTNNITPDVELPTPNAPNTANNVTPFKGFIRKADTGIDGLRNGHLAGKVHPKTGVPFDEAGFPDFSANLYKGGANDVIIKATGNRASDFTAANKAAGYSSTPKGYTWHHHQNLGRMQLVEREVHRLTGHTGGFTLWNF